MLKHTLALAAGLALSVSAVFAQAAEVLKVSAIPDEAPTELLRKFKPLGAYLEQQVEMKVEFVPVGRDNLHSSIRQTVAKAPGALVVAGGDGTINAVASACVKVRRTLGILPAGTFNYVARNLKVPTDMAQAVAVIVQGQVRQVGVGEINGRIFVHNAGFGLYSPLQSVKREDVERLFAVNTIGALSSIQAVLPGMRRRGKGLIVNVSSVVGLRGNPLEDLSALGRVEFVMKAGKVIRNP